MNFSFLPVRWYDSLPSTNTHLIERVLDEPTTPHGTVVAARAQTAGRGRQQRSWLTAPSQNLTFSFLWNAPVSSEFVPAMAQAISVGIASFLAARGLHPTLKWPNDVLLGGKKCGGILCERVGGGVPAIVAGIGLNVNMNQVEAASIDQPATSLALETGRDWPVAEVLPLLLAELELPLSSWALRGFEGVRPTYTHFAQAPGTPVTLRDGNNRTSGTLSGFNPHGALVLTTEDAQERVFYSGDLTE